MIYFYFNIPAVGPFRCADTHMRKGPYSLLTRDIDGLLEDEVLVNNANTPSINLTLNLPLTTTLSHENRLLYVSVKRAIYE